MIDEYGRDEEQEGLRDGASGRPAAACDTQRRCLVPCAQAADSDTMMPFPNTFFSHPDRSSCPWWALAVRPCLPWLRELSGIVMIVRREAD